MNSFPRAAFLPVAVLSLFAVAYLTSAVAGANSPAVHAPAPTLPEPTVERMIAAVPDAVTSIMTIEIAALKAAGPPLSKVFEPLAAKTDPASKDTMAPVWNAVLSAGIQRSILGGSEFTWQPQQLVCTYRSREITQTEKSLAALRDALRNGEFPGITMDAPDPKPQAGGEKEAAEVWTAKAARAGVMSITPDVEVAMGFAADNLLVLAPTPAEVRAMIEALEDQKRVLPKRWEGMLDANALESPILILTLYDPARPYNSWQVAGPPDGAKVPDHRLRWTVSSDKAPKIAAEVWTTQRLRSARYLEGIAPGTKWTDSATGASGKVSWQTHEKNKKGEWVPMEDPEEGWIIMIKSMLVFGVAIAI